MQMGVLSEAYIVTNHSGNEVIGLCPIKQKEEHTLIHTTHKPVSESVRLSFGKTSSYRSFAGMTFNSGSMTDPSCLYTEHL